MEKTYFSEGKVSPMMLQWQQCKSIAKDAILFFRLGDFYEAFFEDAELISKELELTLTKRQGVPMSGVPWHTAENYIDQLVLKGYRIAVAEQTEDPKTCKGIVHREIKRFISKGTNLHASYLSDKANSFFASLTQVGDFFGLAFIDLSTGECYVTELSDSKSFVNELHRMHPVEILIGKKTEHKFKRLIEEIKSDLSCAVRVVEDWHFEHKLCYDALISQFKLASLDGLGLKAMIAAINALGALVNYLKENLCQSLEGLKKVQLYTLKDYMSIDRTTLKNLELVESIQEHSTKNTLLEFLDETATPMGGRLLRRFLVQPLMKISEIELRQNAVEVLMKSPLIIEKIFEKLSLVRDLERLINRVVKGCASPKDLVFLKHSIEPLPFIKELLKNLWSPLLIEINRNIHPLNDLHQLLKEALVEDPPLRLSDGHLFREGYCSELDQLYSISQGSKTFISEYQEELRAYSKIKNLKVGYSRVSGFYIEVSRGQTDKVPSDFLRRQTMTNTERYITPRLKEYEDKMLKSEEKIAQREQVLFFDLVQKTATFLNDILSTAEALALLDVLSALAKIARLNAFVKPIIDESDVLEIKDGRHPVVENVSKERFIPNDTFLDAQGDRMMLITGPNMAGKSTYMRQVALIVILSQIGSFVPARFAKVGLIDKVFSRIGASDDLARGQSTFMVEMSETANILNNATARSLVILDEIGRGTSTYDGISIAWSTAEYLLTQPEKMAKTLFATHYFELTKLEEKVPGVLNYKMAVHETGEEVSFLRKVVRGKADRSYGIHVAKLSGMPNSVILRAREILAYLEENGKENAIFEPAALKKIAPSKSKFISNEFQLTFFN